MSGHDFRIRNTRTVGNFAELWMDGVKQTGVRAVKVKSKVNKADRVVVTYIANTINDDSDPEPGDEPMLPPYRAEDH